jgi:heme-degrading monooxygenase HmoA
MASILTQFKVKDFSEWKKIYDSKKDFRASSGALSSQVFKDAADPNLVTLISKWDSLANAQKFAASSELRSAQQLAGVQGVPSVSFLSEV